MDDVPIMIHGQKYTNKNELLKHMIL
jgi:hypothetical protein